MFGHAEVGVLFGSGCGLEFKFKQERRGEVGGGGDHLVGSQLGPVPVHVHQLAEKGQQHHHRRRSRCRLLIDRWNKTRSSRTFKSQTETGALTQTHSRLVALVGARNWL